jgi:phenylalanyl-tRNA synthetase alpha subunit
MPNDPILHLLGLARKAVRLGLAQGSGLERMAKVVTTIHDLVGD